MRTWPSSTRALPAALFSLPNIMAVGLVALAVSYFTWYIGTYAHYPADDAFIHMRIARNFVEHGVPYFNPDQMVAGSSSVVWLLVVSGLFWLFGPEPQLLVGVELLTIIGLFGTTVLLLKRRVPVLAAIGLAFLLVACSTLDVAALLMETPLALLFWVLSVRCIERKAWARAGLWGACACATRYEFVIWLALIVVVCTDGLSAIRRITAGMLGPLAGLAVFNTYFFHTLIPNTVKAKTVLYGLSTSEALLVVNGYLTVPLFILLLLVGAYAIYLFLRDAELRLFGVAALFGVGILSLYMFRAVLLFPWYIPIYLFPIFLAALMALRLDGLAARLALCVVALFVGLGSMTATIKDGIGLVGHTPASYRHFGLGLRVQQYLAIGADLAAQNPTASLMTPEIGALGWTFNGPIIDAAGLVSPECLRYHPMAVPNDRISHWIGAIPPQAVRDLQPDIIVSLEFFSGAVRRDLANGALPGYELRKNYLAWRLQEYSNPDALIFGSRFTQVFVRVASPQQTHSSNQRILRRQAQSGRMVLLASLVPYN